MHYRLSIIALMLCLYTAIGTAQQLLQSPEEYMPHAYGTQFTPHHLLVDYFEYVATNSEWATLRDYGRTNQHRPLIYMILSSPDNLKNLETIRLQHLQSTGLETTQKGVADKAIVWLSYGVHGNEAGASESAMATLYELVRPDRQDVKEWLKNTIVILDPCLNPDGYSRYTHWNNNVNNRIPDPRPSAREHQEPWPGGRVNHYLFDLNRDWAWQTQIESQQRMLAYYHWLPHVHVDLHEMFYPDPYYFAPAAQPYHKYITEWQANFQVEIGKNHARYFDQNAWLYFTREFFDLLYPSYGDTYPSFHGAIGMTYEQGGHSKAGRAILRETGDTLRLADRILHHTITSLSTIEISSKNATQLIKNFKSYYHTSRNAPEGKYKAYIVKGDNPAGKIKALTTLLDRNKIQYGTAKSAIDKLNVFHYQTLDETTASIGNNDLIIPAQQVFSVLAQVLFEPQTFLADSLTYDITAWSIPYAYGLETYASSSSIAINQGYDIPTTQNVKASTTAYAYLATWNATESIRFLAKLHQANIKVRAASKPFRLEEKDYPVGTLVITKSDNPALANTFDQRIRELASMVGQQYAAVQTGMAEEGPDLGSDKMRFLNKPNVLVLAGTQVSANALGQVWHFFEQEIDYPLTIIEADQLNGIQLDDFQVLILPSGSYSNAIQSSTFDEITDWVKTGGKLIALESALSLLEEKPGYSLQKYATSSEESRAKSERDAATLARRLHLYEGQERRALVNAMPGAIFKLQLDNSHPLAYGFPDYYYSLKTSRRAYQFLKNAWNVGYIPDEPQVIGFAGTKARHKMEETTVFGVQDMGSGVVVYLVDNPLFRGFWENGKLLFGNAVFIVGE